MQCKQNSFFFYKKKIKILQKQMRICPRDWLGCSVCEVESIWFNIKKSSFLSFFGCSCLKSFHKSIPSLSLEEWFLMIVLFLSFFIDAQCWLALNVTICNSFSFFLIIKIIKIKIMTKTHKKTIPKIGECGYDFVGFFLCGRMSFCGCVYVYS